MTTLLSSMRQQRKALLCYTLRGTQPQFGENLAHNPDHFARIYVCGSTLREMAELIKTHLPKEKVPVCEIAIHAEKSWPPVMKYVRKERGVWVSPYPNSMTIYQVTNGELTEID